MPRRRRVHLPDVPLHIVQRGHNREACFFSDEDFHCYRRWLGEALAAHDCALHGYVLMTNHVHLLLSPRRPEAVPPLMIALGRRYVQYINRTYRRSGTLWDGRYKSSLVQAETYLLACQRYIELNPVRAGMTDDPAGYRWSSYRANGLGQPDPLLSAHPLYLALGTEPTTRRAAYRALFRAELDGEAIDAIRQAADQSQPLGDGRFHAQIARALGERRVPRPRGRPRRSEVSAPFDANRQATLDL